MYVLRILFDKPVRLILTITGIALCVILILFILGVYSGVAEGSIQYIKNIPADVWVLQKNNTNIIRGTSIIPADYVKAVRKDPLIKSATPVLLIFSNIIVSDKALTVLLTGYVPGQAGGPPDIFNGREIAADNEIVLDRSFALKYQLNTGSKVVIRDDTLKVVGLSTGTNAFVTQYAFVTLNYEQSIIDIPGLASFFIVFANHKKDVPQIMKNLEEKFGSDFSLYDNKDFLENNISEMEAGILPMFYAIVVIGSVVLAIILSLILSVNILEKRRDFAVMKILGSPQWFVDKLIISLSLTIILLSAAAGSIAYFPLLSVIEYLSPEVTAPVNIWHILLVTITALIIGLLSAFLAIRKTRQIYPLEVFQ